MNVLVKLAQGSKPGKESNAYKGDNVSYSAKHKRVALNDHKRRCGNCGATSNLVWATIHGSNGNEHKSLCKACHASYDSIDKNINKKSSLESFIKSASLLLKLAQLMQAEKSQNTGVNSGTSVGENKQNQVVKADSLSSTDSNTEPGIAKVTKQQQQEFTQPKPTFGYGSMLEKKGPGSSFNSIQPTGSNFSKMPFMQNY